MKSKLCWLVVASVAICLAVAGSAEATTYGTLTGKLLSVSPGQSVKYYANGGSKTGTTTAGIFNIKRTDSPGTGVNDFIPTYFSTHCIDLSEYIYYSTNTWTVKDVDEAPDPITLSGALISDERWIS